MTRSPLLRLLIVFALIELVAGAAWHRPLLETTDAARRFWQRDDVQNAPLNVWRDLFAAVGRSLGSPRTPLQALVKGLLGIVFVAIGAPLWLVGAVVIGVLWLIPYLLVALALWLLWVLVALHLLPLGPVAVWAHRRRWIPAPVHSGGCATRTPERPAVPAPAPVVARPAPAPERTTVVVMGPEHPALAGRIDPYTRTAFAPGEHLVRCGGGCGRAYKLATWTLLNQQCPVDQAALQICQDPSTPTVIATDHTNVVNTANLAHP